MLGVAGLQYTQFTLETHCHPYCTAEPSMQYSEQNNTLPVIIKLLSWSYSCCVMLAIPLFYFSMSCDSALRRRKYERQSDGCEGTRWLKSLTKDRQLWYQYFPLKQSWDSILQCKPAHHSFLLISCILSTFFSEQVMYCDGSKEGFTFYHDIKTICLIMTWKHCVSSKSGVDVEEELKINTRNLQNLYGFPLSQKIMGKHTQT